MTNMVGRRSKFDREFQLLVCSNKLTIQPAHSNVKNPELLQNKTFCGVLGFSVP